jgi:GR25 family glycosyltransferase involved in LPS biosynthesis
MISVWVTLAIILVVVILWPLYDTSVVAGKSNRTLVEAYYINMDNRPDRNNLFLTLNRKFVSEIPTHRWAGVKVHMPHLSSNRQGAYGCKMAHLSLLRLIASRPATISSQEAWYLILEDDAKIEPTFDVNHIFSMRAFAPKEMGIIQLCNSLHCEYPGHNTNTRIKSVIFPRINYLPEFRTAAYMIRPEAAKELVKLFDTCPEETAIDHHWRLFDQTCFLARGVCAIRAADQTITNSSIE